MLNCPFISWKRIEVLAHICPNLLSDVNSFDKYKFQQKFADESIYDVIQNMSTSIFNMAPEFNEFPVNDMGFITQMWTEDGICYTFNALNSRDIYTEE